MYKTKIIKIEPLIANLIKIFGVYKRMTMIVHVGVVTALAFHLCVPGSNLGPGVCELMG